MAYNPYIVIPFATWAVAQVAKFAIAALKGKIDLRNLYASGGMPSVHSAVVCSLATTALLVEGPNSPIFGITAILAAIVMYDSFGVRRSTGEQAAAINMLVESLDKGKIRLTGPAIKLREILGHQPREVVIGALLGIGLAGLFNYERLGTLTSFAQVVPLRLELWAYAGIFGFLVLAGWIQSFWLKAAYPKSVTIRGLRRRLITYTQTIGWLGVVLVALQYERASYLAWRIWVVILLTAAVIWGSSILISALKSVPAALKLEANEARKRKWFSFGSRRKSKR